MYSRTSLTLIKTKTIPSHDVFCKFSQKFKTHYNFNTESNKSWELHAFKAVFSQILSELYGTLSIFGERHNKLVSQWLQKKNVPEMGMTLVRWLEGGWKRFCCHYMGGETEYAESLALILLCEFRTLKCPTLSPGGYFPAATFHASPDYIILATIIFLDDLNKATAFKK